MFSKMLAWSAPVIVRDPGWSYGHYSFRLVVPRLLSFSDLCVKTVAIDGSILPTLVQVQVLVC